ncbi:hypothetical protein EVAR_58491_1 [Eumeta japonica]|uniref:Uncharacterized protein n=1 Tax=Eumeta variegata TaxID=151549 RepID=A0A4C1ZN82_EUMVA|nr:hypothetical protein EVAR_58491_1 [Eumeta japonica]
MALMPPTPRPLHRVAIDLTELSSFAYNYAHPELGGREIGAASRSVFQRLVSPYQATSGDRCETERSVVSRVPIADVYRTIASQLVPISGRDTGLRDAIRRNDTSPLANAGEKKGSGRAKPMHNIFRRQLYLSSRGCTHDGAKWGICPTLALGSWHRKRVLEVQNKFENKLLAGFRQNPRRLLRYASKSVREGSVAGRKNREPIYHACKFSQEKKAQARPHPYARVQYFA